MQQVCQSGLSFYRNGAWGGLRHGIFTRHGGVSESHFSSLNLGASIGDNPDAVKENHRRLYAAAGLNGERAVSTWLVHGVDTLLVTDETKRNGQLKKADAIITNLADTPLVMRYADCVPLLFYDPATPAIGLGHAGWRGTVKGMAGKIVGMMRKSFGSRPEDIEVVIGPAISCRNYQVGEEVAAAAESYFGHSADIIWRHPVDQRPYFDLWGANRLDLLRHGVTNVKIVEICTYDNTQDFYSHRAEQGATGRFGVVISL